VSKHFAVESFTAYIDSRHNTHVHHNPPHEHSPFFELLYFIGGASHIRIDAHEYRAETGDMVVYHPRVVHEEFVQPGPYRLVCLRFRGSDIESGVPFPGPGDMGVVFRLPWKERFQNIFEQIVLEHKHIDQWSALLRGTYFTQFVVLLWRALTRCRERIDSGGHDDHRLRIGNVIDLIHSGVRTELSLTELAEEAFMSESHFSHVFKDVTGLPPKQYLIERKMACARELLTTTDHTVAAIAEQLGYETPQYFSRSFKKRTGETPLAFRLRNRKVH
jgi:AraC-like DNA-binding protein